MSDPRHPLEVKLFSQLDLDPILITVETMSEFIDLAGYTEFCLHFKVDETGTTTAGSVDIFVQKYMRDGNNDPIAVGVEQDISAAVVVTSSVDAMFRWGEHETVACVPVSQGTLNVLIDEFTQIGLCKIGLRMAAAVATDGTSICNVWLQAR